MGMPTVGSYRDAVWHVARVDPASLVLDRGLDPPRGMGNFGVGKHGHTRGQFTKGLGS